MLTELHAEIARQGGYDGAGPEPVVSLELFFDGNDDLASIGSNLSDHPGPAHFYGVLSAIRDRPDVHSVWVGVSEVMGPDEWPFSDHVYVVTTASPAEVGSWAASLGADMPGDDWWNDAPPLREIEVPPQTRLVTLWWD
ncbi:hypothetical protein ACQPXM_33315 [Kribbella sp. CA-253562]|uniref:hypothetical protein n=1 Tax=Kribbella sp. CA-253562 TaxID=3239942 RepID=UPI003D948448